MTSYIYEINNQKFYAACTKEEFVVIYNEKFNTEYSLDDVTEHGEYIPQHECTGCGGGCSHD